jgi:PAS domain S-box-containing protein
MGTSEKGPTEQEQTSPEQALARSEENYRTIFNSVNDMIFLHDAETGEVIDVNVSVVENLGYSREELMGMTVADFSAGGPDYGQEEVMRWMRKVATEGPQLREWRCRRKDGSLFWVEVNLKRAQIAGTERVLVVVRDISERKLMEEERHLYAERLEAEVAERTREIRASEERHRALFENVDHAVVITDLAGQVIACNRATETIFGRPREELVGLEVYQALCQGAHREDFQELLTLVLRTGTATQECSTRRADGSELSVNASVSTLRDRGGSPEGMIWILTDLSERERLEAEANRAHEYVEMVLRSYGAYGQLVGRGEVFRRIISFVHDAARVPSPVLLTGESGTGKEAVARSVHSYSPRAEQPFVVVDCAALKGSLLESELFGHEKGAFTGAHQTKRGLAEVADGGTLFLDEIGEMPVELQAKLLRVLERGEFRRVGSVSNRKADIRVIAATNRDLVEESRRGQFRTDLYFRLNVLSFEIPPLRERPEDIQLLANHFLMHSRVTFVGQKRFRPDALRQLEAYGWPGNVRELANVVERAVILSGDDSVLKSAHLPPEVRAASREPLLVNPGKVRSIADAEKEAVAAALTATRGNRTRAASLLGITTVTLRQKIKKYKIEPPKKS